MLLFLGFDNYIVAFPVDLIGFRILLKIAVICIWQKVGYTDTIAYSWRYTHKTLFWVGVCVC